MTSAFDPIHPITDDNDADRGLTIREHFAGLAMQGLLTTGCGLAGIARTSVQMADALIDALNAPQPE